MLKGMPWFEELGSWGRGWGGGRMSTMDVGRRPSLEGQ